MCKHATKCKSFKSGLTQSDGCLLIAPEKYFDTFSGNAASLTPSKSY